MSSDDLVATVVRLQSEVVRQRRRNSACMAIAAVSLLVVLGGHRAIDAQGGAVQPVVRHKVLQAERFELVDDQGRLLAVLDRHETSGQPIVALFDKNRKSGEDSRAFLCLNQNGHPLLSFQDHTDTQRLRVYLNKNFEPQIDMFDEKNNANIEIQAGKQPHLYMRDGSQYTTLELKSGRGGGFVTLKGANSSMAHFGLDENSNPKIELLDKRANTIFEVPKE